MTNKIRPPGGTNSFCMSHGEQCSACLGHDELMEFCEEWDQLVREEKGVPEDTISEFDWNGFASELDYFQWKNGELI